MNIKQYESYLHVRISKLIMSYLDLSEDTDLSDLVSDILYVIKNESNPEDVFDISSLEDWAEDCGYDRGAI